MKKPLTLLLACAMLASSAPLLTGCAARTAQQKKTQSYKRKVKHRGSIPCPTHDC